MKTNLIRNEFKFISLKTTGNTLTIHSISFFNSYRRIFGTLNESYNWKKNPKHHLCRHFNFKFGNGICQYDGEYSVNNIC